MPGMIWRSWSLLDCTSPTAGDVQETGKGIHVGRDVYRKV